MHCRGGVSLLMVFALVFGVLLVSCPAFAVQGGFSRPYTHYADDEDLTVILTNFARSQGLGASFSPGVVGKVSGRFDAVPPETFLKGMQAAFGVTWYRLGSTLYFYSESELSRTFITPRAMTAERLYQMLRQSAVFAPQLPATLAPGGAMIVVSGPPTYLAQISAAVTAFEEAQITNFVMKVFPLKYAWAEDGQNGDHPRSGEHPQGHGHGFAQFRDPGDAGHRHRGQAVRHRAHRAGTDDARGSRCPRPRRAAGRTGRSAECHASEHYGRSARQCGAGQ